MLKNFEPKASPGLTFLSSLYITICYCSCQLTKIGPLSPPTLSSISSPFFNNTPVDLIFIQIKFTPTIRRQCLQLRRLQHSCSEHMLYLLKCLKRISFAFLYYSIEILAFHQWTFVYVTRNTLFDERKALVQNKVQQGNR